MFGAIIGAAEAGLSLLAEREKNVSVKQHIKLNAELAEIKKDWYEEYNRDPAIRSDAILDDLNLKLRLFLDKYTATVAGLKNV